MSNGFRLPAPPIGLGEAYGVLSRLLTRQGLPHLDDFEKFDGARQHRLVDEVLHLLNACLDAHANYYFRSDAARPNKEMKAHYRINERNAREQPKRKYRVGRHAICFVSNLDRDDHFKWWAGTFYRDVKRQGDGPVSRARHPLFFETYEIDKYCNGTIERELPKHDERASTMYLVSTNGTPAQLLADEDYPAHDAVVQFLPSENLYRVYDPSFVVDSSLPSRPTHPRKVRTMPDIALMRPLINAVQGMNPKRWYFGKIGGGGNYHDQCRPMSLRWMVEQVAEWVELPNRRRYGAPTGFQDGEWNYFTTNP